MKSKFARNLWKCNCSPKDGDNINGGTSVHCPICKTDREDGGVMTIAEAEAEGYGALARPVTLKVE
jgi:hypothetical protein